MRWITLLFLLFSSLYAEPPSILVSIAPQKYLVEQIAGNTVSVNLIVPSTSSPHSFEPSPRHMIAAKKSHIWFRIGEPFEQKLIPLLQKNTLIVDQRQNLPLLNSSCHCSSHDPHIWLSPLLLKKEAEQITLTLCSFFPEHAPLYFSNLQKLHLELDALHAQISHYCFPSSILVSHPAFGYFCRDYGIEQLSIEMDGKEATPQYTLQLMQKAQENHIHCIFLQKQYPTKAGKRIASELGATTCFLDPYAENVIANLKSIAEAFRNDGCSLR